MREKLLVYDQYQFNYKEKMMYGLLGMGSLFGLLYLFYGNIRFALILSPVGCFFLLFMKKIIIKKKKRTLKNQFKEGLYALSTSITAGQPIEKAFESALQDLRLIYSDDQTYIIQEFQMIVRKMMMNETIEDAFYNFALRANDEDITNFAHVFMTAKRTGGNILEILQYSSRVITEKIEISNSIEVVITQKKYEQKIMAFLVPMMIIYLNVTSNGFLDVMYTTNMGRMAMTIALILYIFSFLLGNKIVDIEV